MSKPGPKPAPTNLRLLRGQTRPDRINRAEPKPPLELPVVAPDYLDDDARQVWERLAPTMIAKAMLTTWDVDLFATYCTAVVHHRRAVVLVNQTNVLITARTTAGGNGVVKHPAMQVIRDQAAIMIAIGGRFCLTPSDRYSTEVPDTADDSDERATAILD
jgi:P27 family predicted phage terminase small subunit